MNDSISLAIIKGAVCLYCSCEWSHLSSLCNENNPLVIWWYTISNDMLQWIALGEQWWNCFQLCYSLLYIVYWTSMKVYYEYTTNGGPLPTRVRVFHFVQLYCFTAYNTLLTKQYWWCMPRKTSLKLVHYCTLLSMAHHFEYVIITFTSHFVIKQAVKFNGLTS